MQNLVELSTNGFQALSVQYVNLVDEPGNISNGYNIDSRPYIKTGINGLLAADSRTLRRSSSTLSTSLSVSLASTTQAIPDTLSSFIISRSRRANFEHPPISVDRTEKRGFFPPLLWDGTWIFAVSTNRPIVGEIVKTSENASLCIRVVLPTQSRPTIEMLGRGSRFESSEWNFRGNRRFIMLCMMVKQLMEWKGKV